MYLAQVIFKHVAHHPNLGKIGNGEEIGCVVQAFNPLESSDVLFDDGPRNWCPQVNPGAGMIGIAAQHPDMLFGGLEIYLCLVCRVLRNLQILLRQGAVGVKQLRPVQRLAGKRFVGSSLLVIRHRGGQIRA